jgi:hypothetical protein
MPLSDSTADEFTAGAGFEYVEAYTFFALVFIGGMLVWGAWAVYSLWRTNRENNSSFTDIDFISSLMQLSIVLTLCMVWVAF